MEGFARRALAKGKADFLSVEEPFSYFHFREDRFQEIPPLARIFSQVRCLEAKLLVIESISPDAAEDLVTESEDLATRFHFDLETKVTRLSFFAFNPGKSLKSLDGLALDEFLGYAIVREDVSSRLSRPLVRIHESVLRSSRLEHNYVHSAPVWSCRVGERIFPISGFLYAQQNGFTNVCAHVALRTMASVYHPKGDISYREINEFLGIDHQKNWVGCDLEDSGSGRGLSVQDMVSVLDYAGARCIQADYSTFPESKRGDSDFRIPYQHYLYGSIESGYPSAIIFDTADENSKHVVPVFGHTFNRDLWVSNAERSYFQIGDQTRFLPSDSWLSTFIMHDDNWGSNFCCPKHYLKAPEIQKTGPDARQSKAVNSEWLAHVIATLPKGVQMNPIHAEAIGLDFLSTLLPQLPCEENEWAARLAVYAKDGLVVYRPVLITGINYVDHLAAMRGWSRKRKIAANLTVALRSVLADDRYWMVEMSMPELFSSNLRKIGEVLLNPSLEQQSDRNLSSFILARMPGHFALLENRNSRNPKFRFLPSGVDSHVQLYGCEKQ